jgi:hypothetical protein
MEVTSRPFTLTLALQEACAVPRDYFAPVVRVFRALAELAPRKDEASAISTTNAQTRSFWALTATGAREAVRLYFEPLHHARIWFSRLATKLMRATSGGGVAPPIPVFLQALMEQKQVLLQALDEQRQTFREQQQALLQALDEQRQTFQEALGEQQQALDPQALRSLIRWSSHDLIAGQPGTGKMWGYVADAEGKREALPEPWQAFLQAVVEQQHAFLQALDKQQQTFQEALSEQQHELMIEPTSQPHLWLAKRFLTITRPQEQTIK